MRPQQWRYTKQVIPAIKQILEERFKATGGASIVTHLAVPKMSFMHFPEQQSALDLQGLSLWQLDVGGMVAE